MMVIVTGCFNWAKSKIGSKFYDDIDVRNMPGTEGLYLK